MQVIEKRKVEDCLDGSQVQDLHLDAPITSPLIRSLGQLGKLAYFESFSRPFFTVNTDDFKLKGVEGNCHCRLIFFGGDVKLTEKMIVTHIESF